MRFTLVTKDNVVVIDGKLKKIDLSSLDQSIHAVQWDNDSGWIEYQETPEGKPQNEKITSLDQFQEYIDLWNTTPSPDQDEPAFSIPSAQASKDTAYALLLETDYIFLPDVNILNKDEFITYRAFLRDIVMNPREGVIQWPKKPTAVWA